MTKRTDKRSRCIDVISAHMLAKGLSETSLRQLADAADVSNRMLLYYFEDKADILTAVMTKLSADLTALLASAIPAGTRLSPSEFLAKGAEVMLAGEVRSYMQLSIEIVGAAGRGIEPYANVAPHLFEGFLVWIEAHLSTEDPAARKAQAALTLSAIDGLTVLSLGGKTDRVDAALATLIASLEKT